jgi:AhpD family alkylhydroperoxidase
MKLDNRTRELIAVGTALGANCHPCLEYHVRQARELRVPDDEIAEAIEVGKLVRRGAQSKIDKLAADLTGQATQSQTSPTQDKPASVGCGCGA